MTPIDLALGRHSIFGRSLCKELCPVEYRQTPAGEPGAAELLRPGTMIRTSYRTGPYVVLGVAGPYTYEAPEDGRRFLHWSLLLMSPNEWASGRKVPSAWINEIVAVGGRFLKLFEPNQDEVFIVEERAPAVKRPAQMSLFA